MIGETLGGKYTIDRLLGEGGMGAVYEARHTTTGHRVAIKVVTGDVAKNPVLVKRFEVEAKAAATIESEHVVKVLDVGHDPRGGPFTVMELLSGEDLDSLLLRTGPLAPDAAVKIAVQACQGLAQAHEVGIVHRDIKPGNVFLSQREGGTILVKLVDFGVAKLDGGAPGSGAKLTRTGAIIGSPLYMSPEQARTGKLDHRTDLWSLGVVLYELLAGRTPLHDVEALGELIIAICSAPPPPLRTFAPWVDEGLAKVVERALSIDPNGRYSSALEMAEALRPFLRGSAADLTAAMLVSAAGSVAAPPPAPAPVEPRAFARTEAGAPLLATPALHAEPSRAASGEMPRIATPPLPQRASRSRASLLVPAIVACVVIGGGFAAAYSAGLMGGRAAVGATPVAEVPAPPATATSSTPPPAGEPPSGGPLAPLFGVWKSDTGRTYDAVPAGDGVELRLRDASQLEGQGYQDGEARFILSAIPGETATFIVEDRVRPLPPENTTYDLARARPTCLVTWTEIGGKQLHATVAGNKLTVELVVLQAEKQSFVLEGKRVVRCSGLTRARVSPTTSVLTRQ